jgi:hypothetical protein
VVFQAGLEFEIQFFKAKCIDLVIQGRDGIIMRRFFVFSFCLLLGISLLAQEVKEVTVTGKASGPLGSAREQALAQALREAVRKGAGVDIVSETKVSNFVMEYDRVMTSSFGYVQDYEVTGQKYNPISEIYTVTLKAKVGKKTPGMDKVLALRMLVKRMGSPRVIVECQETITGVDSKTPFSKAILEEMAQKTGFEIFNSETIKSQDNKDALRAELLGDDLDAKVKKAGITSTSDFKILAKVNGSVGSLREPFPDVKVRNAAVGVDLQAVWTDTGEIAATVSIPTTNFKGEANMNLPYDMPDQLVRFYLNQILQGKDKKLKQADGYKLYRRILAKWITELDLGAKIKLEFKRIDKADLDRLIEGLKRSKEVSYVWRREFDRRLFSIVEVETRLTSQQLENKVLNLVGKKFQADVVTKRRLRFVPKN